MITFIIRFIAVLIFFWPLLSLSSDKEIWGAVMSDSSAFVIALRFMLLTPFFWFTSILPGILLWVKARTIEKFFDGFFEGHRESVEIDDELKRLERERLRKNR